MYILYVQCTSIKLLIFKFCYFKLLKVMVERRTNEMIPKTMATVKLQNCNHKSLKFYSFQQHHYKERFPMQVSFTFLL